MTKAETDHLESAFANDPSSIDYISPLYLSTTVTNGDVDFQPGYPVDGFDLTGDKFYDQFQLPGQQAHDQTHQKNYLQLREILNAEPTGVVDSKNKDKSEKELDGQLYHPWAYPDSPANGPQTSKGTEDHTRSPCVAGETNSRKRLYDSCRSGSTPPAADSNAIERTRPASEAEQAAKRRRYLRPTTAVTSQTSREGTGTCTYSAAAAESSTEIKDCIEYKPKPESEFEEDIKYLENLARLRAEDEELRPYGLKKCRGECKRTLRLEDFKRPETQKRPIIYPQQCRNCIKVMKRENSRGRVCRNCRFWKTGFMFKKDRNNNDHFWANCARCRQVMANIPNQKAESRRRGSEDPEPEIE